MVSLLARPQDLVLVDAVPAGDLVDADAKLAGDEVQRVAVAHRVVQFARGVAERLGR